MKITLYNDGEKKPQSFEASNLIDSGLNNGYYSSNLMAFGETEQEAYGNLKKAAEDLKNDLSQLIEKLNK